MLSKKFFAGIAAVTALILAIPTAAFASHFRSSYGSTVYNAGASTITWTVDSAWRKGSDDDFGTPSVLSVPSPTGGSVTVPNAGNYTAYGVSNSASYDTSEGLYDRTTETNVLDVSTITDDGTYELFTASGARVSGVQNTNGNSSFSQWMRFTKTGSSYNLPPEFNNPSLYLIIYPGSNTTVDFTATDPEGGSVTYDYITATDGPYYGGTVMPCSSMSNGILTIGSGLCTNGEDFAAVYFPGSYWTAKMQATDAQGNMSVVDTLMRVLTPPDGASITGNTPVGNGLAYDLDVAVQDTVVDTWDITCTNVADPADVVTASGTSSPVRVQGLTNGATYSCDVDATNQAGTYSNNQNYSIGPVVLTGVSLNLDLEVGADFLGASSVIQGGNLQPNSAYDLTLHSDPIIIYQGTTDPNGAFNEVINIPAEACLVGVHELILTGIDVQGNPVSDNMWIELGTDCSILQISKTEVQPTITTTTTDSAGLPDTGLMFATLLGILLIGGFLFFAAGGAFGARGRLRLAAIDVQMRERLQQLNAVLERLDKPRRHRRGR